MSARRSRILRLAVLGLLNDAPMHGYELRKRLNGELGVFRAFSYGSLYPCLQELLERGLISRSPPADTPQRSGNSRSRIIYQLTSHGREHLCQMLAEVSPATSDDECFGVHFALFGHTRADVRLRILEGRRSRLEERLEHFRARLSECAQNENRIDDYTAELHRHGADSVEREVRWLTGLIQRERTRAQHPYPGGP